MRETDRELLIFYKATDPDVNRPLEHALHSKPVLRRIERYVRCTLFKSYEPDRRYVAQFGVDRAPALICVRQDGTYHTQVGSSFAAEILRFLGDAQAPGTRAVIDPRIPRRAKYVWHRTLASAEAESQRSGRPILLVFHRWLSQDWYRLKTLLSRREVFHRLANMVHCRIHSADRSRQRDMKRFGVTKLPALVIVKEDGSFHALEIPMSSRAIVRFAERCFQDGSAAGTELTAAATQP